MEPFALPDPLPPALPGPLALNRGRIARPGAERHETGYVASLLGDPGTRIVLVDGARVAVDSLDGVTIDDHDDDDDRAARTSEHGAGRPRLDFRPPARVSGDGEAFYLGRDEDGAYVAWSSDFGRDSARGFASLRDVGHLLDDRDVGLATAAVALSQWRRTHRHCPRCGAATDLVESGWAARCPIDGHVVYPRTDPAVIMAVHDGTGRLLLARSVAWPTRRRSVLAGFVEAGEAPESAVRREVAEEVGVRVGRVEYAGAQPWPFPASLMLGYHAWVDGPGGGVLRPDGAEITHADWFSRAELCSALADGRVQLPMRTSIALALIESWYGGRLPA